MRLTCIGAARGGRLLGSVLVAGLLAGCHADRTVLDQTRIPRSSPNTIAAFSLTAASPALVSPGGVCDTTIRELPEFKAKHLKMVAYERPAEKRRTTIGLRPDGSVGFYNDTYRGKHAEWVIIDEATDDAIAVSMRDGQIPRRIHGQANDFWHAAGLGVPAVIAQDVVQRCQSVL